MKKTISILMALVLALSMCAVTAFAATSSDAQINLSVNASSAKPGDIITVTISAKADSKQGLGAVGFRILYDTDAFEYVAGSFKDAKYFGSSSLNDKVSGQLTYAAAQEEAVTVNATVATAQFKVLKTSKTIELTFDYPAGVVGLGDYDTTNITDAVIANSTTSVTVACAHAHKTSTVTKEPTCTETGTQSSICNDCGATLGTETISAKGHSFGAWEVATPATCTAEGTEKRVCSACGHEETRAIAKAAHTPGEWEIVNDATCTEAGEKVQKCSVCGEVLATEVIPAKGHTLGEDAEITKMPTCTEEGEQKGVCTVCGAEVVEAIPALGHDVTEWTIDKEATCTEDGLKHGICNRCEEEVEEVIPAKGHDFGEWTVVKEATETEEGLKERVCSVCGEKETEVIPKLGATESDPITQPSIPKTSGAVVGSVAALAMLSMAAGVAAVTLKKKKDEEEK